MKLSRSTYLRLMAAVLAAILAFPAAAFAALEDNPSGTSSTNPNAGDAEWREGWGNSLWPDINVEAVPTDGGAETLGFLYDLSRLERTPVPGGLSADGTWDPSGSMLHHSFDLETIYDDLSPAERDWIPEPGQIIHHPLEGVWKLNMRYYNENRISTRTVSLDLGIDITPPRPIAGLTAAEPALTEHGRRTYSFLNQEYDDLSGAYWYELFVNGEFQRHTRIIDWLAPRATIETLPPGINVVGFRVQDRATNYSRMVTRTEIVDPDVPTLSITSPGSGQYLAGIQNFEVRSTDAACSPRVTIKIDGRIWRDLKRGPYRMQIDTRWLSNGYHTMTVTAKDLYGHTKTMTRGFYVDNRRIGLSSISDFPDPFYPVKVDEIKDKATIRCTMDEGATDVFLNIYATNSAFDKQPLVQKHWTRVGSGTFSTTWDGKVGGIMMMGDYGTSGAQSATLYYQWHVKDRAGNWTVSSRYPITFRNYEVVRTSSGSVRVVPR